ncbi:conserved hypothetical protein [Culex quinquefasciatus]|uniref:Uncharacterized protein n=1 Tax=Culex quinquefasciatus TaxID=7176 RepID=B0XBX2_CULQU|nr:conserved hypothetical protein [Culex quinquefasciatus]|eukprot:XP_001867144.1 conserved hypothetical protein [Culex quinquefasciatus]
MLRSSNRSRSEATLDVPRNNNYYYKTTTTARGALAAGRARHIRDCLITAAAAYGAKRPDAYGYFYSCFYYFIFLPSNDTGSHIDEGESCHTLATLCAGSVTTSLTPP